MLKNEHVRVEEDCENDKTNPSEEVPSTHYGWGKDRESKNAQESLSNLCVVLKPPAIYKIFHCSIVGIVPYDELAANSV
jgi:hypothetical protein